MHAYSNTSTETLDIPGLDHPADCVSVNVLGCCYLPMVIGDVDDPIRTLAGRLNTDGPLAFACLACGLKASAKPR